MEVIAAIVGSFVTEASRYTISPIKNIVKYISNPDNKVQSLKNEISNLNDAKERVQHSVDDAKRNGHNIESGVDKWLVTVNKKITEVVEKVIKDHETQAKKKCFVGLCPNLWARYKFSKNVEEEAKAVAELLKEGNFDKVSYSVALQDVITFSIKGFEAFESRTTILNGIMDALKDSNISIIGVHGMGGIGKTTLVKEVSRQVKESKLFDSVVLVTVTQTLDVKNIQNQIADSLGLKFNEQSIDGRAHRLREKLKQEKILVVLDDVWARLDLEQVGIPSRDAHEGSKILLTSRDLNVLSNEMDSQKNFSVGDLTEEEAWDLFQKMAGECVRSHDLQPIAMDVAKKCARLPIAIATVARALKNKSSSEWKNALRELKKPSPRRFTGTMTAEVYSAIELSYKYLRNDEDKMTFLLCSLIGHNGLIEELLRYTTGLGLYDGISKIDEARDKVISVVNALKASCLLLDSYDKNRFDIHDVVWDVALSIASRDHCMLVQKYGEVLKEWPSIEMSQNCEMITLRHPDIKAELPAELVCPHLSFFFMDHDDSLKIPVGFFTQTKNLKVLCLTGMLLPNLPVSISLLRNLRTLSLNGSALEDITVVGELKKLEILTLAHSDIKALPKEIAQLTQLKLLDLSGCTKLEIIPPNVLSSLSEIEELYMDNSFAGWEDEVVKNEERNASLEELNHLPNLTTLYVDIPKSQIIPEWLLIKNLDRYKIFNVYDREGRFARPKYNRMLKFQLYKNICLSFGMKLLMKNTEYLYLEQLKGVKNVLAELNNGEDFPCLKELHIENSSEVEFIITEKIDFSQLTCMTLKYLPQLISFCSEGSTTQQGEGGTSSNALPLFNKQHVFPRLEELELCHINVRRIWHNQPPETSYCIFNLTRLVIEGCDNVEQLLSPSIIRCLAQLKHFKIRSCKYLREIISTQEIADLEKEQKAVICFPQLISLRIEDILNLIKFCSGNYILEFPILKRLNIIGCPKLQEFISNEPTVQALFNQKVAIPSLEWMKLIGLENVEMIFEVGEETSLVESQLIDLDIISAPKLKQIWSRDLEGILSFQSLRRVRVWACGSLKNVFPASIAKNLPQLENLRIVWCGVEEIVCEGEGEGLNLEEQSLPVTFKFPRLSNLELRSLNKLKCFYGKHRVVLELSMLKRLDIDDSSLQKMVASQHQEMNEEAQSMQSISHPFSFLQQVVPKLEELRISNIMEVDCSSFPISLLQRFHSLESLELSNCDFKDVAVVVDAVGTLSTITKLKLTCCRNIKQLGLNFGFSASSSSCFQNLTTMEVYGCAKMINLVTVSVAQNLVHLTTMEIRWCIAMTEIVAKKGDEDGATSIIFTKLKCLHLDDLQSLTSFCSGNYTFEFPSLEEFFVRGCPTMKVFCHGVLSTPRLQRVRDWGKDKGHWAGELNTTIQLMYAEKVGYGAMWELKLSDKFPEFMEIWNGRNPQQCFNFRKLNNIELYGCNSLKYGFTSSIAFSLNNLRSLKIKECINMEQVIRDEHDEVEETTYYDGMFFALTFVRIESCANLKSFYLGASVLQFLKLEAIGIYDCPKMIGFTSSKEKIRNVNDECNDGTGTEKKLHYGDLNIEPFINYKVVCPQLSILELSSIGIHKIWPDQLQAPSSNLKRLVVKGCHNLKHLFPSLMVRHSVELTYLCITDCKILEEVISMEGLTEEGSMSKMLFPKLKVLKLEDLPKLTRFCSENNLTDKSAFFNEKVDFPSLKEMKMSGISNCRKIWSEELSVNSFRKLMNIWIESCAMLLNIFPFNMMESLNRLEKLQIGNCGSVEEIFESHALVTTQSIRTEAVTKFIFPGVTYLQFDKLPNLKGFYSKKHVTEWPSLKTLTMTECPKVEIFASACHDFRETLGQCQSDIANVQQPFFWVNEDTFPILEELSLKQNDTVKGAWIEQVLPIECFRKLKVVELSCIPDKLIALSYDVINSLPNLEKLILSDAPFCQIFQFEEVNDEERHASTLSRLIELKLSKLPVLTHLWKEQYRPTLVFCNLNILEVLECGKLKTLAPCWISLRNLITLKVSGCVGLINLMACSVAKSMVLLREMTISDCKMIQEIIACEYDDKEGGIIFSQLKQLELSNLPSLSSFCLGDYSFEFSALTKVIVRECPTMENFCQGHLNTPYLRKVWLNTDEERWQGDLKNTIKHLFREKNVQTSEVAEATL